MALLTAVLIKLDSHGPVFYKQERVGMNGSSFVLMKFRSMRADAEADGPVWASEDDERTTRVGQIIRKIRVDEIPQFWNILRGEMSFVGPRPERPHFVAQLAQASARSWLPARPLVLAHHEQVAVLQRQLLDLRHRCSSPRCLVSSRERRPRLLRRLVHHRRALP